jgi:hypothetical protein
LANPGDVGFRKQRFQPGQNGGGIGTVLGAGYVVGFAGGVRKAEANQLGQVGVDIGGFGIKTKCLLRS